MPSKASASTPAAAGPVGPSLAIVEAPVIGAAEPLVWTTAFLAAFAVTSAYQLWTHRWVYLNALVGK